jgi:acetolactate synthase regulatory subunit
MSTKTTTVLVVLRDGAQALSRLLALCHRRGWTPVSLRSVCDGARCEVTMRLSVPGDRRGTDAQVRTQIGRLVDVEHVAVDTTEGLPDHVAFAAVRRRAPWSALPA